MGKPVKYLLARERERKRERTEMPPVSMPTDSRLVSGLKDMQVQESGKYVRKTRLDFANVTCTHDGIPNEWCCCFFSLLLSCQHFSNIGFVEFGL